MRFFEFYRFRNTGSSAQTARERLKRLVARERVLYCESSSFSEQVCDDADEVMPGAAFQSHDVGLMLRHAG